MTAKCPTCGGPVALDLLYIDTIDGKVAIGGYSARLTGRETDVLVALSGAMPAGLSVRKLEQCVYGNVEADYPGTENMRTLVSKIRRRLRDAKMPMRIDNTRGRGYKLVVAA